MPLSDLQKTTAQAIVNIFETSRVLGDYGKVTLLAGDKGHLTYGRSQTTLANGNLYLLIKAYCDTPGTALAGAFRFFLDRLLNRDLSLDADMTFRGLLHEAGRDPVMHTVQDDFFDRVYWKPSVQSAANLAVSSALATAVIYDSNVHGSWGAMRARTLERFGSPMAIGEKKWIENYVAVRKDWLANNDDVGLHKTVYRMESFQTLILEAKWELPLPLRVRSVVIDEESLSGAAPFPASAHGDSERTLHLVTPNMTGEDVRAVQKALAHAGFSVDADSVFGTDTDVAVRRFQRARGLKDDGIVGPATRAALGL